MTAPITPSVEHLLRAAGLDPEPVVDVIRRALTEDLRDGPDVTTNATVPVGVRGVADLTPRRPGVLAGLPVAASVLELASEGRVSTTALCADGDRAIPGVPVLTARGPVRDLLTAERTALNLIGQLSGVATLTRSLVDAVAHTGASIRDTRKTVPGLRLLQKYAVRCGGGVNHRMSLGDEALIKDNHVLAAGGIAAALAAVRAAAPGLPVEVECDTLEQVAAAVDAGATLILLDNMSLEQMRRAVAMARAVGDVRLEASGGLTPAAVRAVAETGVDYLAIGALTHSAPVLDIGLDLRDGDG
ncbi:MAG: carboxylating nicotinate-nucleotide diphosphorylase [Blastococcus sp.]